MHQNGTIVMSRTQITMDPELQRQARGKASQLGISLAEYVRRLVEQDLDESRRKADLSIVFDLGNSGGSNIGRDKDAMIGEAVEAEFKRRRRR